MIDTRDALSFHEYVHNKRWVKIGSTPASHPEEPGFKYRLGNLLSWLGIFVTFLTIWKQISGQYLNLGHACFLANPFLLIDQLIIRRYTV
jgi:hypothetical protein